MAQIFRTNATQVAVDRRLLPTNTKVVLSQREAAKIPASVWGGELLDLGPGLLFSTEVTLSSITDNGRTIASITPGFRGRVVSTFAVVSEVASTASKTLTAGLFVDKVPGTNEIQTITITGSPTGGTFTLTYAGQTTAAIAYNANAAAVQSALEALSNIAVGDVACAGGALPGTPVTVTFQGSLAGTNVAQMSATGSLTGGTAPTVAVTTPTSGATGTDGTVPTAVSGGSIVLTTANCATSGAVVAGTPILDGARLSPNDFTSSSVLSWRTTVAPTAFSEGKVLLGVLVAPARKTGPLASDV